MPVSLLMQLHARPYKQYFVAWLLVPANAALLNLIGFTVGVVGLLVTIAGFVIALRQLSAIKTETEAASAAISSVQIKVTSLDVAKECQAALSRISDIRQALKIDQWESILSSYEVLITIFLRLAHSSSVIKTDDSLSMIKMTEDMARMCNGIRRNIASSSSPRTLRGQDQALRNFSDIMTRIAFSVEKDLRA